MSKPTGDEKTHGRVNPARACERPAATQAGRNAAPASKPRTPAAPTPYRPGPTPRVLQAKAAFAQRPAPHIATTAPRVPAPHPTRTPPAPPAPYSPPRPAALQAKTPPGVNTQRPAAAAPPNPVHVRTQKPAPVAPPSHATARVIQRSKEGRGQKKPLDNPYKKQYNQPVGVKKPKRKAAQNHTLIKGPPQPTKRLQVKHKIQAPLVIRPTYVPPKDSAGNKIWNGERAGVGWSQQIRNAMAPSQANGCQINKGGCTGGADGIDHMSDFATEQSGLTQYKICDGNHHWKACYKQDAVDLFNNYGDASNFQWACTQCNSEKSGAKGLYLNHPQWLGACPGNCGYAFKGEQM